MAIPNIVPVTKDVKVPSSGQKIRIRPYTVKEEESLSLAASGDDWKEIHQCVKDLIQTCVMTPDVDITQLAMFDLEYLFLQLRALSVGSKVTGFVICRDDEKTQVPYTIDYSQIKVEQDPKHSPTIKLSDGYVVEMNYPGLEFLIDRMTGDEENPRKLDNSLRVATCVKRLYKGEDIYDRTAHTDKDYQEFINNLPPRDYAKISKFFETMPKATHKFKIVNPETKAELDYVITGLQAFFRIQPSEE